MFIAHVNKRDKRTNRRRVSESGMLFRGGMSQFSLSQEFLYTVTLVMPLATNFCTGFFRLSSLCFGFPDDFLACETRFQNRARNLSIALKNNFVFFFQLYYFTEKKNIHLSVCFSIRGLSMMEQKRSTLQVVGGKSVGQFIA